MPPLTKPKPNSKGPVEVLRPASLEDVQALIHSRVEPTDTHIKFLLMGDPGVGKTYFCATAEDALMIVTEGSISLGTLAYAQEALGRSIPYALVDSAAKVDGLLNYLHEAARRGDLPYRVVVVDSISRYCEMAGNEIAGGGMILAMEDLDEDRNRRFWQALLEHMKQFLLRLQQLPLHVICTAHVRRDEKTLYPLIFPESLRRSIAGYFNLVGYMDRVEPLVDSPKAKVSEDTPSRVVYFDRAGVVTKNAGVKKMPSRMVNPTFADILRVWKGENA